VLDIAKVDKQWNKHEVAACVESMIYGWNVLEVKEKTLVEVRFLPAHREYVGLTEQESLKKYIVRLYYNSEGIDAMMQTCLHEMVHVKQFRERMLSYEPSLVWFDGTKDGDKPYRKTPWEKQAYKLESILLKKMLTES